MKDENTNRQEKITPMLELSYVYSFFYAVYVVAWENMNLKCVYWIIFLWNSIKYFITFYRNYDFISFYFFYFIAFGECIKDTTDTHSFLVKL